MLKISEMKTAELIPYANNPRKNGNAVGAVAASIKEFGFKVPIVIDEDGIIVAGHTRLLAAKELGLESVPCIVADDLTPEQVKKFRLADNRVGELSEWDFEKLAIELEELDFDMEDLGFGFAETEEPLNDGKGDETEGGASEAGQESQIRLLNLEIANFAGVGEYGIPAILPESYSPVEFMPFSDAAAFKGDASGTGIHFFLDDYRFARVWNSPQQYVDLLRKFACVLSPDFSLFMGTPKAVQIFNHYRKHWCAAYWQANGIKVIPTLCWSDEASFGWCFDGEPEGGSGPRQLFIPF